MKARRLALAIFLSLIASIQLVRSADTVPYSIKSIKYIGAGYVELIGPGKIQVNGKVLPYEGTMYVKAANIGTMTGDKEIRRGCMLAYSFEGYTENISVTQQSCNQIIKVMENAK